MIVPLSIVVSNLLKLGVQFLLFLGIWGFFLIRGADNLHPHWDALLLVPVLIVIMGFLGLAFGILISSMTTKYRDLKFLVVFGVQLMMYASPIVYPLSVVKKSHPEYVWMLLANPVTSIIEAFKYAFLGVGDFEWLNLGYSLLFTVVLFVIGLVVFHRVEKSFMDTV